MSKKDLFDDTTMTFGEHLEALRYHLFRAIIGLVIGSVVAFLLFTRCDYRHPGDRWIRQCTRCSSQAHRHR